MPIRHGNRLSHNESQLPYLTARVPQTTVDEVAELQERTGLCKRDVIKEAIRQLVQRHRQLDAKRDAKPQLAPADPTPPDYRDQPYFGRTANAPIIDRAQDVNIPRPPPRTSVRAAERDSRHGSPRPK
jgi:hypothetical protein